MAAELQAGTLKMPAPSEKIRSLPLIGDEVYATWEEASQNLESTARKFEREIKSAGEKMLGVIGGTGGTIVSGIIGLFVGAVVLALAYQLFTEWLNQKSREDEAAPESAAWSLRHAFNGATNYPSLNSLKLRMPGFPSG